MRLSIILKNKLLIEKRSTLPSHTLANRNVAKAK